MTANTQVIFRPVVCVNSVMARFQLFVMFIVFRTCHGALQCKHDACGESTRYTEPHESKTPSVIEEIPYMISPEDFYYKFVAKHRPLVLRRTATYWPANKVRWTILFMFCLDLLLILHYLYLKIALSLVAICFYVKRGFSSGKKSWPTVWWGREMEGDEDKIKFMFNFTPIPVVLLMVNCKNRNCTISEVSSDNKIKNNTNKVQEEELTTDHNITWFPVLWTRFLFTMFWMNHSTWM